MSGSSSEIQNNRTHHRQWLSSIHSIQSPARKIGSLSSFEYAVQPDGFILGERLFQERRQSSSAPYSFESLSVATGGRRTSLASVEAARAASSSRYQAQFAVPEPPSLAAAPHKPCSSNEPQHAKPGEPAFLSPTRRMRNRHNAVYGEHLPNELNAAGHARKIFGTEGIEEAARDRVQSVMHGKENHLPKQRGATAERTSVESMDVDEDDDAFLADIDVDQLVAQRQQQQREPQLPPPIFQNEMEFDYEGSSSQELQEATKTHRFLARHRQLVVWDLVGRQIDHFRQHSL